MLEVLQDEARSRQKPKMEVVLVKSAEVGGWVADRGGGHRFPPAARNKLLVGAGWGVSVRGGGGASVQQDTAKAHLAPVQNQ